MFSAKLGDSWPSRRERLEQAVSRAGQHGADRNRRSLRRLLRECDRMAPEPRPHITGLCFHVSHAICVNFFIDGHMGKAQIS